MDGKYAERIFLKKALPAGKYFSSLPAVRKLAENGGMIFSSDVTFFVGENGSGKSTLLEAIAVAAGFNAEGGTKNFMCSSRKTHSELHEYLTIARSRYPKDGSGVFPMSVSRRAVKTYRKQRTKNHDLPQCESDCSRGSISMR